MYNHEPEGYECPFCRLANGAATDQVDQRHVVERTGATVTFVAPKTWVNNAGNVLVVPTQHYENLYDLPDEIGAAIHSAGRRAALAMKAGYECAGVSTRQHNEPAGNQDVWHFHLHVFPRYAGDLLYRSDSRWLTKEEMSSFVPRLRAGYEQVGA